MAYLGTTGGQIVPRSDSRQYQLPYRDNTGPDPMATLDTVSPETTDRARWPRRIMM